MLFIMNRWDLTRPSPPKNACFFFQREGKQKTTKKKYYLWASRKIKTDCEHRIGSEECMKCKSRVCGQPRCEVNRAHRFCKRVVWESKATLSSPPSKRHYVQEALQQEQVRKTQRPLPARCLPFLLYHTFFICEELRQICL